MPKIVGGELEFIPSAREAFMKLCSSSDMYLVCTVSQEEHAQSLRDFLEREGLYTAGLDKRVSSSRHLLILIFF